MPTTERGLDVFDRLAAVMESEVSIISTGHGREHAVVHNPIF